MVYLFHLLRKYILHERILKRLLNTENNKKVLESSSYNRDLLDSFTLIYHACDQLEIGVVSHSYQQRSKHIHKYGKEHGM